MMLSSSSSVASSVASPNKVSRKLERSSLSSSLVKDERSSTSSSIRWFHIRYIVMVFLAFMAGSMDWKMQRQLERMASSLRTALRVATIELLEHLEGFQLEHQAREEEQGAAYLESKVQELENKGTQEESLAQKSRERGEYLVKMAALEQNQADVMRAEAQHSEELRKHVLTNLTEEEAEQQQTLDLMRSIHQGACKWYIVSTLCNAVGGITGLQQRADAEALQIQSLWQQATALRQQELLQEMVADMLQGKADTLNKTAQELLRLAAVWDEYAQAEFDMALEASQTAKVLGEDAAEKEQLAAYDAAAEAAAKVEEQQYLHMAQMFHTRAYWYAMVATIFGFCALVYFVCTAAPRFSKWAELCSGFNGSGTDVGGVWHCISYLIIHVLFFLTVVGMTGQYFANMPYYAVAQRAVVVVWFAFLGTAFQTFFLNAIPQFLVQVRAPVPDLQGFCLNLGVKALVIFCVYIMEVLFVWLALGNILFTPVLVNAFNTLGFCLFTVGLALLYAYYFDQHQQVSTTARASGESITVWRCSDSGNDHDNGDESTISSMAESTFRPATLASEITPLRSKEEALLAASALDVYGNARSSLSSSSPATNVQSPETGSPGMSLRDEFCQLILPFEILVIASMVAILRNCLHTVWNSQATGLQCAVLLCATVLLVWGMVLVKDLTCEECYDMNHGHRSRAGRSGSSASSKTRQLDAVELVQV